MRALILSLLLCASCGDDMGALAQPDAAIPERFAQDVKPDGVFRRVLPVDAGTDLTPSSAR